jgi:hypothetical protein
MAVYIQYSGFKFTISGVRDSIGRRGPSSSFSSASTNLLTAEGRTGGRKDDERTEKKTEGYIYVVR